MHEIEICNFTVLEPGKPVLIERVTEVCPRCRRVGLRIKSKDIGLVIAHAVIRRKEDQMADATVRGVFRAALFDYCVIDPNHRDQSERSG
jgi:hypothetical protein